MRDRNVKVMNRIMGKGDATERREGEGGGCEADSRGSAPGILNDIFY